MAKSMIMQTHWAFHMIHDLQIMENEQNGLPIGLGAKTLVIFSAEK